jgi:hypothetical protein
LVLYQPMGHVISSLPTRSLNEIHGSVVEEPVDFALHLGWCFTASHMWKYLNSELSVLLFYRSFVVSITMTSSTSLCL